MGSRISKRLQIAVAGTCLISLLWTCAAVISSRPLGESLPVVGTQTLLAFLALLVFLGVVPKSNPAAWPGLLPILGLHVLVFYGIGNVVPALMPEMQPASLSQIFGISHAPPAAYALATVAAILFTVGMTAGAKLGEWLMGLSVPEAGCREMPPRHPWLPDYRLSFAACVVLLILVVVATGRYGLRYGSLIADPYLDAGLSAVDKLLYYGILWFLPVGPGLAACAYVQADTKRGARWALSLLIISASLTILAVSLWGMRSASILVLLLPAWLLVDTGKVSWVRASAYAIALVALAYLAVTAVRGSGLTTVLAGPGASPATVSEFASGLGTSSLKQTVLDSALVDASYRVAGLEGVAALVDAQAHGRLSLKWGRVTEAGLLQALPTALRSGPSQEAVKTAPAYYGIFQPGDWVTTMLAESVLDFGAALLFFPAVVCGVLLSLLDRVLLWLGTKAGMGAFLIARIAWLVYFVQIGSSLADVTVLFLKATAAITVVLLVVGVAVRMSIGRRVPAAGDPSLPFGP